MISFIVDSRDPIRIPESMKAELALYRKQAKRIRVTISPLPMILEI